MTAENTSPPIEQIPPRLQWNTLETDALLIDREGYTDSENLAIDFGHWVLDQLSRVGEGEQVHLQKIGPKDLFSPGEIYVDVERDTDTQGSDFVFMHVALYGIGEVRDITLELNTESMPPLEEGEEEEVIKGFKLYSMVNGEKSKYVIDSDEETEPEVIVIFRNTLERLKSMVENDYELVDHVSEE